MNTTRRLLSGFAIAVTLAYLGIAQMDASVSCDYSRSSIGQTPLMDMTSGQTYQGLSGGLYGAGSNTRPEALDARLSAAAANIAPDANGQIVVLCIGDDTADSFCRGLLTLGGFNPAIRIINATNPAKHLEDWAGITSVSPWNTSQLLNVPNVLTANGVAATDVQVALFASAVGNFNYYLTHPFAQRQAQTVTNLGKAFAQVKLHLPNALLLVTDVQYFDYGKDSTMPSLHAEPLLGYENGFAMQQAVLNQNLSTLPVTVWAASIWADGATPRADGMQWLATTSQSTSHYQPVCAHENANGQVNGAAVIGASLLSDPMLTVFRP
jgi:hypothetical protein